MKCANCGAEIKVGCVYCSACGHEAQIVPDYNILEDDWMKSLVEAENKEKEEKETAQRRKEEQKKQQKKQKAHKKKLILIWSLIAIVVLMISLAVILAVNHSNKNSFSYQYEKGMAYAEEGNYTKALTFLETASSLEQENTDVLLEMAKIYEKRENEPSMEAALLQVLTLDKNNTRAYQMLIALYDKQKKYDAVTALYDKAEDKNIKKLFAEYVVLMPEFSLESDTYNDTIEVELKAPEEQEIYYTLDGSSPIENGKKYLDPLEFEKEGNYTVSAVCCDERGIYSEIAEAEYEIEFVAPDSAEVSPGAGTYHEEQFVTIQVPEGMKAYYTWNDTTPTQASDVYAEPLAVPEGNNVLSILLVDSHDLASPVVRYNYIYLP